MNTKLDSESTEIEENRAANIENSEDNSNDAKENIAIYNPQQIKRMKEIEEFFTIEKEEEEMNEIKKEANKLLLKRKKEETRVKNKIDKFIEEETQKLRKNTHDINKQLDIYFKNIEKLKERIKKKKLKESQNTNKEEQ